VKRDAGFTLVELLLALALTGIVSLLAVSATRFAAVGLDRVSAQSQRLETRRTLEELLRRSLAATVAEPSLPNVPALEGTSAQVTYVTLADDSGAGLYSDELALDGRALVLTRRIIGTGRAASRTVLAPRVVSLKLAYFGTSWQDYWNGTPVPPRLVRIALDLGDGLSRPPIVVRLWTARP
jgi:general secretion pathway protein J